METHMAGIEVLTIKDYLPLVGVVVGGILAISGKASSPLLAIKNMHETGAFPDSGQGRGTLIHQSFKTWRSRGSLERE